MRRGKLLVPLSLLALITAALPAVADPPLTSVIVVLEDGAGDPAEVGRELARAHGGKVGFVYRHALQGFSLEIPPAALAALERNPEVAYVDPDVEVRIAEQVTPTGIDRMEADLNPGATSYSNVDIAVLDTGIYIGSNPDGSARGHLDLNLVRATDCTSAIYYPLFGGCSGSGNLQDENGHGTHVAGIAAAKNNTIGALGAAPGARLWSVKVINADGTGSLGGVLAGIDTVTAYAAEIEVANMSLTVEGSYQSLTDAVTNSTSAGVVYAVAAGNSGADASGYSPANHPYVITTSALADFDGKPGGFGEPTCRSDVVDDTLASWSNYGDPVDIAAPGVCIYSTWLNDGYHTISGTSMASPYAAGAAARYIAENGRANNLTQVLAIRDALVNGGLDQTDPCGFTGDPDSTPEPLLFINGSAFGGTGTCESAGNTAPTVSISSPGDGAIFTEGDSVTFTGSASDTEDGDLTGSLVWTSSLDGQIGTGGSFTTTTLSAGSHTITASVSDSGGADGSASITITVEAATNTAPTVSISSPADGAIFTEGDSVTFTGSASDTEDGDLTSSLIWTSSADGQIGTGGSFTTTGLSAGSHTITASVSDGGGADGSASIAITVEAATAPGTMHVSDLDAVVTAEKNHWRGTVTIRVHDDNHDPVSGVTVSGSWSTGGTASCTTGTDGSCVVDFGPHHKRISTETFTVTGLTHSSLSYDSSANHDPEGDSDGTSITMVKP